MEPAQVVNGFNVFENHTPHPVLGPGGPLLQRDKKSSMKNLHGRPFIVNYVRDFSGDPCTNKAQSRTLHQLGRELFPLVAH